MLKRIFCVWLMLGWVLLSLGCSDSEPLQPDAAVKTEPSLKKVVDWEYQIAYQRGLEAVNWATPAVSMMRFREAYRSLGGAVNNTIYYLSKPPTPLQEALTANNQTPYASTVITTKDGPVVLDIPPASSRTAIFGSAVNSWQVPVADIGPAGLDQGRGGKYLFLPPGYAGEVPEGYFPIATNTYNVFVALRLIPLAGVGFEEAAQYARHIKLYPFSTASTPSEAVYIDIAGKPLPTLPIYDLSFYTDILSVLNEEPLLERDKVMGGMLASIGIEKGKVFQPEGKVRDALEKAVADAKGYLDYLFQGPGHTFNTYWEGRQWMELRQPSREGFVFDEGDYLLLDARAGFYSFATFIPRRLGKASTYMVATKDSTGEMLSGKAQYKLTVPANVPVRNFWSIVVYSFKTKAWIYNELNKVGLSSYDKENMVINEDGSVDLYFGGAAPAGLESNWVPTAGEDFFLMFRFYGPEAAIFDKTFKLADIEKLDMQRGGK